MIGATDTVSFSTEKVVLLDLLSQLTDSSTTGFHLLDNQLVFYPLKSDDVSRPAIPVDPFGGRGYGYRCQRQKPGPLL